MAALGHSDIGFISGPLRLKSAEARKQAFIFSMEEIGLEAKDRLIVEGTHTIEGGISACAQLLADPFRPTAILCCNDMTALGAMRKSYEEGLAIPLDLSVRRHSFCAICAPCTDYGADVAG